MKKNYSFNSIYSVSGIGSVLFLLFFYSSVVSASGWVKKNPFEQKCFIENKSQFDGRDELKSNILFGVDDGGAQIYFTKSGLTYRLEKTERVSDGDNDKEPNTEADEKVNYRKDLITLQWLNANPAVEVVASEPRTDYYTYRTAGVNIVAKAFTKLTYKNLYPNIDVEYTFHPQEGIKYALILHPGADVSVIKIKYSSSDADGEVSVDKDGNIHYPTLFGDLIDHAPATYYKSGGNIESAFALSGNIVSFNLQGLTPNAQTIIIDPWLASPNMNNSNKAWEIEGDGSGNAYMYGGDSPLKLRKYNSAGTVQWTYTTGWDTNTVWIGTLKTDPTGNSYITAGSVGQISKVNNAGAVQWLANSSGAGTDEYWALAFNCDYSQLVVGGTRLFSATGGGVVYNINLTNGSVISNVSVAHSLGINPNEVRSICSSPNGNYYFHTLDTIGELTQAMVENWGYRTSYTFAYGSPDYGFTPQPQNIIRATSNYIYTMNGDSIFRRSITNGTVINAVPIPGGGYLNGFLGSGISPYNNGIDIDSCGYVYVGSQLQVHKFDAALNLISSATTVDAVYDVAIGHNGDVFVCGNGYAGAIAMGACNPVQAICVTTSTLNATASVTNINCGGQCNATATATPTGGTSPYSYLWSSGSQTGQTATGLCAGSYTVTITDASSNTVTASATVTQPNAISVSTNITNVCNGNNNGAANVSATGGTSPLTYLWSTGGNSSAISGLTAGSYTVTVTDNKGCTATATAIVTAPAPLNIKNAYYICEAGSVTLTAPGGASSYMWSPGATLNDSTIADPLASPFVTTTYTVTVTNGSCQDTASATVYFVSSPIPPTVMQSGDTVYVTNVYVIYQWYFNGSPIAGAINYYYIPQQTGYYAVQVTDTNGCRVNASSLYVTVTTSVQSISGGGQEINIFPNPATNEVTISGSSLTGKLNISIVDVLGQVLYSSNETATNSFSKTINISGFANGVYFVQIMNDKERVISKLIKQ